MANIFPDGWQHLENALPSVQRELETLRLLADQLPEQYTVYHGVHWSNVERGHTVFGEIDFVVVNLSGHMLLIEQKLGFLDETEDGLVKEYTGKKKSVPVQMARSRDALLNKFRARPNAGFISIDSLLFCPHYTVRNPLAAGIPAERIVDSQRKNHLAQIIQSVLPPGNDIGQSGADEVHRFLSNILQLQPDVNALVGRARTLVTRVSGGLAHWARQLEMEPFRLRVTGTAGSGKTQLALAEYRHAIDAGKRPLYVCYNRPLADHFEQICPKGGWCGTFHALCEVLVRHHGETPDFSRPDIFDWLVERAALVPITPEWQFDSIIIDEGQDWIAPWFAMIERHAKPDTRWFWLEDPMQNLYGRPSIALPNWVRLNAQSNYRSPRPIVRFLQSLLPDTQHIEAASPLDMNEVEFLTYKSPEELLSQVKIGIKDCYAAGFKKADVAVISYHGRDSSYLQRFDRLGDYTFRTFTGQYDFFRRPVYGEGDLLMESVMRFKGQSAPAIVLAEIDFDTLDEKAIRRLFVGATRATMKLVLVLSETSARTLIARN